MNKQLISLLILVAALSGAIYFLTQQSALNTQDKAPLFPKLAEQKQRVERVEIANATGTLFTAVPTRTGWKTRLMDNVDYPVDQQKLAKLVESLGSGILFEEKTARAENYARLGLKDISDTDSQATQVIIYTPQAQYKVLIGNASSTIQGSYVRLVGEQKTWLLDTVIDVPSDTSDWLQQPILDIASEQITMIRRTDGKPLTVSAQSDENTPFVLQELQADQGLKYDTVVSGFVDNIVALDFDGIATDSEKQSIQAVSPVTFEIVLKTGDLMTLTLHMNEEVAYVRFEQVQPSGAYWHGLTYRISNFSAGQINKVANDFIEQAPVSSNEPQGPSIDEGESPSGS